MAAILKEPSLELKVLLEECKAALLLGTGVGGVTDAEAIGGAGAGVTGGDGVPEMAKESHKEKDPHKETHKEKEAHKDKDKERERDALREFEEGSLHAFYTDVLLLFCIVSLIVSS